MQRRTIIIIMMALVFTGAISCTSSHTDWYKEENENKPYLRWWWLGSAVDKEGLDYNLEEFAAKGFGGVEITALYGIQGNEANERDYLSPEWMQALSTTLNKCAELGLEADMSNCSGWPFGGSWIDSEHAAGTFSFNADTTAVSFTGTGQKVKRAGPGAQGLVMDHYSTEALQLYLAAFDKAFSESRCSWPKVMFNDSFEVYGSGWARGFEDEFFAQHGYRIEDRLKAFARNDGSEESASVIADYRYTLGQMYLKNFVAPWNAWVHSHGMLTRNQAHGAPANLIDVYASSDIPECEAFGQSPFDIKGLHRSGPTRLNDADPAVFKFASSAAHLTGKRYTSCETLTWLTEHFHTTLALCKPEIDLAFASGANHLFLHGAPYSPKDISFPGWKFYATINLSPSNPSIWEVCEPLTRYITRCQAFLTAGQSDADFLLYFPEHDIWHHRFGTQFMQLDIHKMAQTMPQFKADVLEILSQGYDVDYISDNFISELSVNRDGSLRTAAGTVYKALVLPSETLFMPEATSKRLVELQAKGAKILSMSRLAESGVAPESLMGVPGIHMIRRRNEMGSSNYFIANLGNRDLDTLVTLSCPAASVEFFDAMTGERGLAESEIVDGNHSRVRLQLASGASLLVKCFPKKVRSVKAWDYLSPAASEMDLSQEGWTLEFERSFPPMPENKYCIGALRPWTELPGGDVVEAVGTYSRNFELSPELLEGRVILDLGDVRESAVVRINGKDAGTVICAPFSLDITDCLKAGENRLEITVRNLPANRIAQMDRDGIRWRIFKDVNIAAVNSSQVVTYEKAESYAHWSVVASGLASTVSLRFCK